MDVPFGREKVDVDILNCGERAELDRNLGD